MCSSNEWYSGIPLNGVPEGTDIEVFVTEELSRKAKVFIGHLDGSTDAEPCPGLFAVYENGQWAELTGLKWRPTC